MTRTGGRGIRILGGAETAVAAARPAVISAIRSAFHRGLAQTPPDFPSAPAPLSPPAHTGRPDPNPSPLPPSARPKPSESSKDAFLRASHVPHSPGIAFNHATPHAGARRAGVR